MRKLTLLVTIAVLMASCTQSKIGYVDVKEVMKEYEAAKLVEDQLKLEQAQISKSIDSIAAPFQAKVQEFYKNSANMSSTKRQAAEQELQQENQMIQQQQQQAQQYLQQKGMTEIDALTKNIDSTVADFASKNGYQMVIATQDNGQVIYGDDKSNLTEVIIDLLNVESDSNE